MTRKFSPFRFIVALLMIIALPLVAEGQSKRRAVAPHQPPATALATLTGTVTDASTGAAVVQAAVIATGLVSTVTDTQGKFTAKIPTGRDISFSVQRNGYETLTTTVNISGDATRTFHLAPKATTTVRTIAGATSQIDTETIEFGYIAPFSGYVKDTKLNLCTAGGTSFTPDRAEIKKITGPVQISDAVCCSSGPIPAISVQLRSGATSTAGLIDACVGYKVDLIGREHTTNAPVFVHFSDIAEVDFP